MSLAKRMLVDFLNCWCWVSDIDDVDTDEGDAKPRLVTDGSTGVVGTIVDSAPLFDIDKYG